MTEWHDQGPAIYVARMAAILNRWFTTYEAARATLAEGVRELGLDPADPDWVRPSDQEAWERLLGKRELAI